MAATEEDDEDFHFFGTPIGDEEESRQGQHRKDVKDPAATRALPLHKQVRFPNSGAVVVAACCCWYGYWLPTASICGYWCRASCGGRQAVCNPTAPLLLLPVLLPAGGDG